MDLPQRAELQSALLIDIRDDIRRSNAYDLVPILTREGAVNLLVSICDRVNRLNERTAGRPHDDYRPKALLPAPLSGTASRVCSDR